MSNQLLTTIVAAAFVLLTPRLTLAQSAGPEAPSVAVYTASYAGPASAAREPELGPEAFVVRASAVGRDHHAVRTIFREGLEHFPESTVLRLARQAYDAELDPSIALTLDETERADALAEGTSTNTQRVAGILLGIPAALTGAVAVGLFFGGLFADTTCGTLLIVPICTSSTDHGLMAASALTGTLSLTLIAVALGLQIDGGNRRGRWRDRLEASWPSIAFAASDEGGTLIIGGSF